MGSSSSRGWGERLITEGGWSPCCEDMARALNPECQQHEDVFDCPDTLIHRSDQYGCFGIIVHDGGHSSIKIDFCPWCGERLG
jgi:hypothetical protein